MERGGLQDTALLQAVMTRECAEVRPPLVSPISELILVSKGSYCHMRTLVSKLSFRRRRYLLV